MIEPEKVQDRRMQIMHVHFVLDGFQPKFIRRAIDRSAMYSSTDNSVVNP